MNILAVITARGNSKGLPHKSLRPICGKPVIAYVIDYARSSLLMKDNYIVSSEDDRILKVASDYGAPTLKRPAELSQDTTPIQEPLRHAVLWYEQSHGRIDIVINLYHNIPIREAGLAERALKELDSGDFDSVTTRIRCDKRHPYWCVNRNGERLIKNNIYRRQDLPEAYQISGAITLIRRDSLFNEDYLGKKGWIQIGNWNIDIDDEDDLFLAEMYIQSSLSLNMKSKKDSAKIPPPT